MNEFYEMFMSIGGEVNGRNKQNKLKLAVRNITLIVGDRSWTEDDTQQAMLMVVIEGRGKILNGSFIAETLRNTPMRYDSEQGKFVRSICAGMSLYATENPLEGKSESAYAQQRADLLSDVRRTLGEATEEFVSYIIDGDSVTDALDKVKGEENVYDTYAGRKWWNTIKHNLIPLLEGIDDES